MIPLDLSAEVGVLGRDPLSITEFGESLAASGAPRTGLGATFLLPDPRPNLRPFVDVRVSAWHADYHAELAYDATVLGLAADIGFRFLPIKPPDGEGVWAFRPFFDVAIGLREWSLLHRWWDDQFIVGSGAGLAAGFTLGDSRRNVIVRARYEASVGPALQGVLDSARSDLGWTLDPMGGQLGVSVGFGWR